MRYSVKVVYGDRVEPTIVVETEDFEEIKRVALEKLALISDEECGVYGIFISGGK